MDWDKLKYTVQSKLAQFASNKKLNQVASKIPSPQVARQRVAQSNPNDYIFNIPRLTKSLQQSPVVQNIKPLNTAIKATDYGANRLGHYIENTYIDPMRDMPKAVQGIVNPQAGEFAGINYGKNTARLFNTARLGVDALGAIPDPTDRLFTGGKALLGYSSAQQDNKSFKDSLEAGLLSATGEKPAGLGDAVTRDPLKRDIGNLAELPIVLVAGFASSRKNAERNMATALKYENQIEELVGAAKNWKILPKEVQIGFLDNLRRVSGDVIPDVVKNKTYIKETKNVDDWVKYTSTYLGSALEAARDPSSLPYFGLSTQEIKRLKTKPKIVDIQRQIENKLGMDVFSVGDDYRVRYYNARDILSDSSLEAMGLPKDVLQEVKGLRNLIDDVREINKLGRNLKTKAQAIEEIESLKTLKAASEDIPSLKTRSFVGSVTQPDINTKQIAEQEYREWQRALVKQEKLGTTSKAVNDLVKQLKDSTDLGSIKNSDNWKDKAKLTLVRETMDRNFEDVMKTDAPAMKKKYLEPVYEAVANETRFLNKERGEIKNLGIKPGSAESAAIQDYGEGILKKDDVIQQFGRTTSKKIFEAEKVLRKKYDTYLEEINKTLKRNGYDPIPKRKDYFKHFKDLGSAIEVYGIPTKQDLLPTDISGLTHSFKPGKSFFSSALPRFGGEYQSDAIRGIDDYLEGASKQIYRTDAIKGLRELDGTIRKKYAGTQELSNFVSDLTEFTNTLAGKQSILDRGAEALVGRNIYRGVNSLRKQTSANMIGANVAASVTNFIPLTQSLATTSKKSFVNAMFDTVASVFKKDDFIDNSDFLTSRVGSDPIYKGKWGKIQDAGGWLFKIIDNFTSQVVTRSRYLENLDNGMSPREALKDADSWAKKAMAGRSAGEMPTLFNSKSLGLLTQFQLEVNNQLSFAFKDIPRNFDKKGTASAMAQLFIYSYIFNNLYEKALGRRPALDPIGVAQQAYEDYTSSDVDTRKATSNLVENTAEQLPFASTFTGGRIPIGAAVPNPFAVLNGESTVTKELMKPVYYVLPPTGGSQIRKTVQGLKAFNRGASKTDSGNVRFAIPQTGANFLRTAIAGQYSTPEANEYFRKGQRPLTENQTKAYESLGMDYYNKLRANQSEKMRVKQQGWFDKLFAPKEEKAVGEYYWFDEKTGDTNKVDLSEVLDMPTNSNYQVAQREKEAFGLIDDVLRLDQKDQQEALGLLGISQGDAYYYDIARQDNDLKHIYVMDEISKLNPKDRSQMLNLLVGLKKEVGNKEILSDKVIDDLYDDGLISKEEKKALKDIVWDKETGKPKVKFTGRGSGAKIKKISFSNVPKTLKISPKKVNLKTSGPEEFRVSKIKFKNTL